MKFAKLIFAVLCTSASLNSAAAWKYRSEHDAMRGSKVLFAEARSRNSISLAFPYGGGSYVEITLLGRADGRKSAFLWINRGQLPCFSECTISAKFDKGEVERWTGSGPSDGSTDTIFIDSYEDFVEKLKRSSTVIIEVEIYNGGHRQFTFDIRNLKWD